MRFPHVKNFLIHFQLDLPIIQSPMAGADDNSLAIKVSALGGLGSRGMGYTSADKINETIYTLRKKTPRFNINLFIPDPQFPGLSHQEITYRVQHLKKYLEPYYKQLNLSHLPFEYLDLHRLYAEQLDIVIKEKVPYLSFAFGQLDSQVMGQLHKNGTRVIGTATTVSEAKILEAIGCDAIVVQGLEAGGHRGGFVAHDLTGQMPLLTLLEALKGKINIPLIAAGGIRDSQSAFKCFSAGASALQIGSAFLACHDCSSTNDSYKKMLRHTLADNVSITPAISGRNARGIHNDLFKVMQDFYDRYPEYRLPYPIPHLVTGPLRTQANKTNQAAWIAAWSGIGSPSLGATSIDAFVTTLIEQTAEACRVDYVQKPFRTV